MQAYGTLDLLIKFCIDNGVTDLSRIKQQVYYQYDTTLVKFEGNVNIYNTLHVSGDFNKDFNSDFNIDFNSFA